MILKLFFLLISSFFFYFLYENACFTQISSLMKPFRIQFCSKIAAASKNWQNVFIIKNGFRLNTK